MHPAKILFREMFEKAASIDNPNLPAYFVQRQIFHQECWRRGIDCPQNFIEALAWEESIGLQPFVTRLIRKWRKSVEAQSTTEIQRPQ